MSQNDLNNLQTILTSIPENEVKIPNMPIEVAVQEAEDLRVWVEEDKDKLIAASLDWTLVESLPQRAGATREAQSQWLKEYKSLEDIEKQWLLKAPEGFELRDTLLHAFRFGYRKDENLLTKVAIIAEGATREDMIQDLNDCAVLGKANTELLKAIGFDIAQLDRAAELADELAELLAGAKTEKEHASEAHLLRDCAYAYMKMAVDEIRACGKYVFYNDSNRLKGYRSEYIHKLNHRNKRKIATGEETDE